MGTKTRTNGSLTALLLLVCATLAAACSGPTPQATPATPTPLSVPAVPASSPLPTPLVAPTPTPVPAHFTPASATPTPARPPTPAATPSPPVLLLTHAGDGSGNLYIVEKRGRIRVATGGAVRAQPFLDISAIVRSSGSEQGLLGLAFHPNYRENGHLFVNYINQGRHTVIARYTAPADRPDGIGTADPTTQKVPLVIEQPFANHNGGMLAFGPDGMLWIGMGDGGSGGDPRDNGQDLTQLLGKLLRIDVNHGDPYSIPAA